MTSFLLFVPVLALIVAANLIALSDNRAARFGFDLFIFLFSVALLSAALAVRVLPVDPAALEEAGLLPVVNLPNLGPALMFMAVWGAAAALPPVRRLLSKVLPSFESDSPVHTLALAGSGFLIGNALLTLSPGGLEALAGADFTPTVTDIVLQQLLFVLMAFLGVGLLVRRGNEALNERLGLQRPTLSQLGVGVRWMVAFVFLQAAIGATWALLAPEAAEALGSLNQSLLGNFDTVWEWFVLAIAAGLGEELLFRGALQPVFGLWSTSLIFAMSHVQYGLSPATLTVLLLSLVLGIIRKRSNTTVAVFVHAGYNFTLGLLSLLAASLEPLIR